MSILQFWFSSQKVGVFLTLAKVKVRLHRSKVLLKDKLFEVAKEKNVFEFGFSRCDSLTEKVMSMIR